MFLYKFTITYFDNRQENYFKFCTYPKKTAIYRSCKNLLDKNQIRRYSYGPAK